MGGKLGKIASYMENYAQGEIPWPAPNIAIAGNDVWVQ